MESNEWFIAVTNDEYENICIQKKSAFMLAKSLGVTRQAIYKAIWQESVVGGKYKIRKIKFEDDLDDKQSI